MEDYERERANLERRFHKFPIILGIRKLYLFSPSQTVRVSYHSATGTSGEERVSLSTCDLRQNHFLCWACACVRDMGRVGLYYRDQKVK